MRCTEILRPASAEYFMGARSTDFQVHWDEVSPKRPKRDADRKFLGKWYNTAYEWYQKSDGKWVMGNIFTYAGIIVACCLIGRTRQIFENSSCLLTKALVTHVRVNVRKLTRSRSARNVQHLKCQMTDSFVFGLVLPRAHAMTCVTCVP
jgi:hypothetical protein